jgi:hypothetical protein
MNRKRVFLIKLVAVMVFGMMAITAYAQDDIKQSPSCRYCGDPESHNGCRFWYQEPD